VKKICLIVGLGNPGDEYAHTRHNAGFEVADRLAARWGVMLRKRMLLEGRAAEIAGAERKIVLCEPQTFMNCSGRCVRKLLDRYGCGPEQLLVIYDDIDLPPGKIRMREKGGPGTHNGMRSLAEELGSTDFARIRVGTGDRPKGQDLAAWVLGHYSAEEKARMEKAFDRAAECAAIWAEEGLRSAMQFGNAPTEEKTAEKKEEAKEEEKKA